MELVEVEILGMTITQQYGTLTTGDVLRTSPAFARHLVEHCGAAKYRCSAAPVVAPETPNDEPAAVQKLNKKR
ncbi:hypothetical protein IV454_16360 [Massilia antarctica]|uniref:Uncharacterized protein n=1 Tax=Massilia antarctica TaxID=2765360 RepID=A0AA48WK26_9BURK|nr:hypothetical protein [Massilia antarctica]QPI52919.1 hypothetical protein IV454_16360 [Massilia antarctica]